jgi:hypothetical protein
VRTCDVERARAAAEKHLRGVEHLRADEPAAPEDPKAKAQREQLHKMLQLLCWKLSNGAAKRWGAHWEIEQPEAAEIATAAIDVIELEMGKVPDDPWSRLYLALGMYAAPRLFATFFGEKAIAPETAAPATPTTSTMDVEAKVTKEAAAA